MISNMGDGDLVDPAVQGMNDAEAAVSDSPGSGGSGFAPPGDDDTPERATSSASLMRVATAIGDATAALDDLVRHGQKGQGGANP